MTEVSQGPVPWAYTPAELRVDGLIHLAGIALTLSACVAAVVFLAGRIPPEAFAALSVYLVTLLASIGISAAYNMWPVTPTKWLLRRFDHSAIYLLIAGTYTPFVVRSGTWWLLAFVWLTGGLGVALKLLRPGRFDRLAIVLYLALGWSGAVFYPALSETLPPLVLWLVLAGGLVYSVGVPFHLAQRLRFQNAIWHGFVLVAAGIHFAAVWFSAALA